jgi:hypothetical protein
MALGPVLLPLPAKQPRNVVTDIIPILRDYFFRYRPRALSPSPVTGHDLIREFGLEPSERFKEILDRVDRERLSRENFTRAEALALIRTHLGKGPS